MKIIEKEINVITGEETITERDETETEIKERLDHEKQNAALKADAEIKAAARQAVLDKLGLSADEVAALLG